MNTENALSPHSAELEEALLGSILINEDVLNWDNVKLVKTTDFYLLKNQWMFDAIRALHERGEAIDLLTVIEELRRTPDHFGEVGPAYPAYLVNNTPTHVHADSYAAVVRSAARRRDALRIASEIANAAVSDAPEDFEAQFRRMEQLLEERKRGQPQTSLIHVSDLKKQPLISWLVPGEIPERGLIVLYGPSGIGKSFVALDYAMNLAQSSSVVYVAAEGESGYLMRTAAWCNHHKVNDESLKLNFYMNIVSLLDKTERAMFTDTLRPVKPKLIIVDTLALCMLPGDENSTRDMGLFIKASKELRNALDCAVILVHHTNKEGRAERGNSALRAASDTMIRVSGEDDVIRIECSKTKDAKTFPTRFVKLLPVATVYGSSPVIIASDKVMTSKDDVPSQSQLKILESLAMDVFQDGATAADLIDHTELSKPTAYRALSTLVSAKRIVRAQDKYKLTDQGRSLIESQSQSHSLTESHDESHPGSRLQQTAVSKSHENAGNFVGEDSQKCNFDETVRLGDNHREIPSETDVRLSETGETGSETGSETQKPILKFGKPRPKNPCHRCKNDHWDLTAEGTWYCPHCAARDALDRQFLSGD